MAGVRTGRPVAFVHIDAGNVALLPRNGIVHAEPVRRLRRDDEQLRAGWDSVPDFGLRRGVGAKLGIHFRSDPPCIEVNWHYDIIGVLAQAAADAFENQLVEIVRVKVG